MRRISNQFLVLFVSVYSVIFILYISGIIDSSFLEVSLYAGLLNLINAILTVYLYNKGYKNTTKNFLIYIFGGMIIRMFLILFLFFIFIKFVHLDEMKFVFTFFVLYFITLILEINYYRIKTLQKKA